MLDSFLHKTLRIPYKLNITKMRKSQNPKAVVIFIHGIASDAGMWQKAESEIEGELDIYAVDLIGHGESPKPKWPGAQQLGVQARAIRRMTFLMKKYKKERLKDWLTLSTLKQSEFMHLIRELKDGSNEPSFSYI